ncbi:RCC1 domain-containing protein [Mycetocola spongiae]|uniref:hypothetical protein n=1 Tax=Mycetocola spongiae TaxID=2859226 RepID=UPI001CF2BD26|nr:hypothetical protein [Mycetocola spongiae]UCR88542.1 hypothetical protein KXZ72_11320 [Mycetocola spongiae]
MTPTTVTTGPRPRRRRTLMGLTGLAAVGALLLAGVPSGAAYTDEAFTRSEQITANIPRTFGGGGSTSARVIESGTALGNDGNAYIWGRTDLTMAGNNRGGTRQPVTKVSGLPEGKIVSFAGGRLNFNALDTDGYVWGWGSQPLNDGTGVSRPDGRPERVRIQTNWNGGGALLDQVTAIAHSSQAGAAIRRDGSVWAWGKRAFGGLSDRGASRVPGLPDPAAPGGGNMPVAVTAGYENLWVMLANGEIYYWGEAGSTAYQEYDSPNGASLSKSMAPWFKGNVAPGAGYIVDIRGGIDMGAALLSDGRLLTWGGATDRIGRPTNGQHTRRPAVVPGISDIVNVTHSFTGWMAMDSKGDVYGFGSHVNYEILPENRPALIARSVNTIFHGQRHIIWRGDDGLFRGSGRNQYGEIGAPYGTGPAGSAGSALRVISPSLGLDALVTP